FSFGKIDHDHFALVVALAVLPTVGRVSASDHRATQAGAWALRCIQLGVVATYFLSAVAKVRFGGWGWPSSAIFTWAFVRRGTPLARQLLDFPWLIRSTQWGLFIAELLSPLLLVVRARLVYLGVLAFAVFHLSTWLLIEIHFLPLAICLLAFLPLEKLNRIGRNRVSSLVDVANHKKE
ncbi:MAG: HTTM domain-containing protein, partial [Angustibacter sp.]